MVQKHFISYQAVAWRSAAILAALATISALAAYPVATTFLAVSLIAYALLLWHKPAAWLLVLPALLPVLDLTPWSGWFFLEEIDLFVLTTLAIGYWRLPAHDVRLKFSLFGTVLLAVLCMSYLMAAARGLMPLSPLDANAFSNYLSHYNSLRILKGFVWAILLVPLLRRATAYSPKAFSRYLVPGMLLGLAGATLTAWWERWTFTQLMDFASDYRITTMFSGMNVGGAALDGFLALSVPFLLAWTARQSDWRRILFGGVLFIAATYAVMATFSRGLYLAYGVTIFLVLVALFRSGSSRPHKAREGLLMIASLLCAGGLLWQVFGSGGYRTLAAFVFLFGATAVMVPLLHRRTPWLAVAPMAVIAGVLTIVLGSMLDKGIYVAFALSALFAVVAGYMASTASSSLRHAGRLLAATALLWLGLNAVAVAWHWGSKAAAIDAAIAMAIYLAVLFVSLRMPATWSLNKRNLLLMGIGLLAITMVIPALHSYRMQNRFGEAHEDFSGRLAHWRGTLSMMDGSQWAFGAGLGRFAETFYWKNRLGEFPGTYRLSQADGRHFIQLSGARYAAGFGESLRVGQRVGLAWPGQYRLSLEARNAAGTKANLVVVLCEKWLLYGGPCGGKTVMLKPEDSAWQPMQFIIDGKSFSSAPWYMRPTLQFSISNETGASIVEVTNIRLTDATGRELLHNGNFAQGINHWFFTSDHHHLPWHAKNLWLNVYFEQGVFGLALFTLLTIYALFQLARKGSATVIPRFALFASLSGFMVVGLFDSLLDVPRLAWLFYLLLFVSMLKPVTDNAD